MREYLQYSLLCEGIGIGSFSISADIHNTNDNADPRIYLQDNLTDYEIPIDFQRGYNAGERNFDGPLVSTFINDRVTPSGRQNMDTILAIFKLPSYNEVSLFLVANGRHTMDSISIKPTNRAAKELYGIIQRLILEDNIRHHNSIK